MSPAPREAKPHGEKAVVGRTEPFALDPRDVVEIGGHLRRPLQVAAVAVGKSRADAAVAQGPQVGIGIGAVDDVVRPVVDRRQPRVDRFGDAESCAVVGVVGRHHRSESAHHRKIVEVAVGDDAAREAAPEMEVGIDEAGQGDAVAAVDLFRIGSGEIGSDSDQHAVADVHVTDGDVAEVGVQGDEVSFADDELAARRKFTGFAFRR